MLTFPLENKDEGRKLVKDQLALENKLIARRAYAAFSDYVQGNGYSVSSAARALNIDRQAPYRWLNGMPPSAHILSRLAYAGLDVLYILTGEEGQK